MAGVFISYRRDDCAGHAGRLYDRLAELLGEDEVFIDVDTIEPGVDYGERIDQAVGSCDLLVALIGDEWLGIEDEQGARRLDDPGDLVRLEIASALRREDVRVVPVLVEGASMPRAGQLPEDLKPLARRNALELSDERWRYDVQRLIEVVERVRAPASESPSPPARDGARLASKSRWASLPPRSIAIGLAVLAVALAAGIALVVGGGGGGPPDKPGRPEVPGGKRDLARPEKKDIAMQLMTSATWGRQDWRAQYGRITPPREGCGYQGGIIGFCSKYEDMLEVLDIYSEVRPHSRLARFLPAMRSAQGKDLPTRLGPSFEAAWRDAARDRAFRRAQDEVRDHSYFNEAVRRARNDGLGALGQLAYFDAAIRHGSDKLGALRQGALADEKTPALGGNERRYLEAYLSQRFDELGSDSAAKAAIKSVQRRFLREGKLGLDPPLVWEVGGERYSIQR